MHWKDYPVVVANVLDRNSVVSIHFRINSHGKRMKQLPAKFKYERTKTYFSNICAENNPTQVEIYQ